MAHSWSPWHEKLGGRDWVRVSSRWIRNNLSLDLRVSFSESIQGCRIAAIGPSTEAKIRDYRFAVDLMPERFVAEGLLDAFKNASIEHQKILWVKAEETRDVIYDGLMDQGAWVT